MKPLIVFFLSCMLAHSAEIAWRDWDHVMDRKPYSDPGGIRLIGENFIAVRADQDARPDLSNRYEDYGWPATVVFATAGSLPLAYKRIEQCSPGSSKNLPLIHEPVAFLCTANTCSAPVSDTEKLKLKLNNIIAQKEPPPSE